MTLLPLEGCVLLKPYLPSKIQRAKLAKAGLHMVEPKFEGVPNQGFIEALPAGYDGTLKIGDRVVFIDSRPRGFKVTLNDEKIKLITVEIVNIGAVIDEG